MAKTNYFGPIQSQKDAEDTLKGASWLFYGLGVLNIILGYFFIPSVILDGVVWIVLGFLLSIFRNRIMAVLIAAFALLSFGVTLLAKAGMFEGGQNIFLAAVVLWAAYRIWLSISYLKKNSILQTSQTT